MAYKGLIFDVDGTAVPLGVMEAGEELRTTIARCKDKLHLCAATGRVPEFARPILKNLGLVDPCVIMGGSAIVNPQTFEVLWEKHMDAPQISAVAKILSGFKANLYAGKTASEDSTHIISPLPEEPFMAIYALAMKPDDALALIEALSGLDGVAAHPTPSWDKANIDVHITHAEGTKEYGIHRLKEILGLKSEELVGVGDSANDMPIFNAVGLKIAIGSGSPELIRLADQVAPTLEQDGLAFTINQVATILNNGERA